MPISTYNTIANELIDAQGETGGLYGKGFSFELMNYDEQVIVSVVEPKSEVNGVVTLNRNPRLIHWIMDLAQFEGQRYSNSAAIRLAHEIYEELKVRQINGQ